VIRGQADQAGAADRGPADDHPHDVLSAAPEVRVTRRGLLVLTAGLAGGAIVTALGVAGLTPIVASSAGARSVSWAPVGRIDGRTSSLPDLSAHGMVVAADITRVVTDAYLPPAKHTTPVFVVRDGHAGFTIFDARCTHLGCPLSWDAAGQRFFCGCHGGVFDAAGNVTAGPPPRPLDRYDWKVDGGVLYAGALHEAAT